MGTWNSRGLRGSTLEDFINRTNERYQQQGLALIQKIPTKITARSRWPILTSAVRSIILEQYREFPYVLTQKSAVWIPFHYTISMNTR